MPAIVSTIPRRPLGRTGFEATLFGLGGEGVLRTYGRDAEAVRVIERALDQGVNYFDTAPAYSGSRDYYGQALGERRRDIFLASKTHDRTRDGSLFCSTTASNGCGPIISISGNCTICAPSTISTASLPGAAPWKPCSRPGRKNGFASSASPAITTRPFCSKRCAASISTPSWSP